MVLIISSVVD